MTDEEHIWLLGLAFDDDRQDPPAMSIAALHAAVRSTFERRRRRRSRKIGSLAVASLATTALTGSSLAFAVDGIPTSIRAVMYGVGLPVDSIALARAKSTEAQLAEALRSRNVGETETNAHRLVHQLRTLNSKDRAGVERQASALLTQARRLECSAGGDCVASATAGTSSVTTLPVSPAHPSADAAVPAQDHSEAPTDPVPEQESPSTTASNGPGTDQPSGSHSPEAGSDN
jgi:hypothetical protein